jgi:crotonobetainyl-CoA:carnitine CoA-transferase CaiB-like acyl-CoA transferase
LERVTVDPAPATAAGSSSAFAELLALRGTAAPEADEVAIRGADPFFAEPFRVGEVTSAALAAVGVASNDIWASRGERRQRIAVSVREAAASLKTVDYTMRRAESGEFELLARAAGQAQTAAIIKPWPTRDGRWYLPHFSLPHLRDRVLGVLRCEATPASVSAAVARWEADDLEQAIAAARACGGTVRSREEWLAHSQGAYLAGRPAVEVERVRDGAPEGFRDGGRPLAGVRVLDLTRILAGPIAGRTLAEHGADVLMVTAAGLPQMVDHVRDTSHGKRSCFLDLKTADGAQQLAELVRSADVVIDGYRPGRIAGLGFDLDSLLELRPGLVHLKVTCFGTGGPFQDRGGWDQVAQAVSGLCDATGARTGTGQPTLMFPPACDYNTGYLGAYGVLLALARRAREGGSYSVNVSLCQTAFYIQRQGTLDSFGDAPARLSPSELEHRYVTADTSYGTLRTLGPVLDMSETPPFWARPTPRFGGDRPEWPPREG